jgi:hypothetical protein
MRYRRKRALWTQINSSCPRRRKSGSAFHQSTQMAPYSPDSTMIARCSSTPRSCLLLEPVNALEASVSSAVVPPRAMSHAVAIANM